MSVYNDIVSWASNKPEFVKDALRRILTSPVITTTDIDDLTDLLKKEVGVQGISKVSVPITIAHIPTTLTLTSNVARLLSIENPVNINALYNRAKLEFESTGLTVVYGNNGSGKSGYSKILKKLCWSRHKDVQLKTNVHTNDITPQSVTINYSVGTSNQSYNWSSTQPINQDLNTVFVFDTDCANLYLNAENITEYRPIGLDLLERLIKVFGEIEMKLNLEKSILTTSKPVLDINRFRNTQIFDWYQKIEQGDIVNIQSKLQFSQAEIDRKNHLIGLLNSSNPVQMKVELEQKKQRYQSGITEIQSSLKLFSMTAFQKVFEIKNDYIAKYNAYQIAQSNIDGEFPVKGVGTDAWRLMWNAAKEFAVKEVHPAHNDFPSDLSAEFCVLCQQKLGDDSAERLRKFNLFINDKTSKDFDSANQKLQETILGVGRINFPNLSIVEEVEINVPGFKQKHLDLLQEFENGKTQILEYLDPVKTAELIPVSVTTDIINPLQEEINRIDNSLNDLNALISGRGVLEVELLELEGLEILCLSTAQMIAYFTELKQKELLNQCISHLNKAPISRKIGEILESSAIAAQHQEFLTHLANLNSELASKVSLSKTRTTAGTTYQRIGFNATGEALTSVLSEGEQKVLALASFLSECTIDNRTNSVVFDDPVTSLDQDYRETIASTLVDLAANRQVIVLTHDLYFLRLLLEIHNVKFGNDCKFTGLVRSRGVSGYNSDEIPYLAKNCQQRIDSINTILKEIKRLSPGDQGKIDSLLDSARKKFRMLIEKSVEEILANKTIERFSRNIHVKSGNLSGFIVVEHSDVQFLLDLFGKYSITEHDGSVATIPQLPDETVIDTDLSDFASWRNSFNAKLKAFKTANGY